MGRMLQDGGRRDTLDITRATAATDWAWIEMLAHMPVGPLRPLSFPDKVRRQLLAG
jgi:hypothetical protein